MARIRRRAGKVDVTLAVEEAQLVRSLAEQVAELVVPAAPPDPDPLAAITGLSGGAADPPADPAVQRLLPAAYAEEGEAAEFRRLMDDELRRQKLTALQRLTARLDTAGAGGKSLRLSLEPDDAESWLQALNDMRLVLGVRLDVQEDMSERLADLGPDDPDLPMLVAYDFLTFLQQAVIDALDELG